MAEIKVKALDSAAAMEEVVKRLGVDALIVSTRKIDGQIEIVATNDDPNASRPEVEIDNNTTVSFSDILRTKMTDPPSSAEVEAEKHLSGSEVIQNIQNELVTLNKLFQEPLSDSSKGDTDYAVLRMAGLSRKVSETIKNFDVNGTVSEISKTVAKRFVKGQSDIFDNSEIYFIAGLEKSGKSVFCEKYKNSLEKDAPGIKVNYFKNVTGASDYNKVATWLQKNRDAKHTSSKKCIVEINDLTQLETQLYRFQKAYPDINFCLINIVEVGHSYEFIINNVRSAQLENEFMAITKLDTCDISLQEICALIEMGHRCSFFSGMVNTNEGLYYSRVDQLVSHIVSIAEKQKDL
ncbi:MAG: hypothetical protein EBX05_06615 [Rhodobacteraceae bacterium]|jgi:flagellar biosynthesis GTPase FlhF|nr:hypothetical protein [Paracoccaceae bacterium]